MVCKYKIKKNIFYFNFNLINMLLFLGVENFCLDLEFMTGRKTSGYWRVCWALITPIFMFTVFVYSMSIYEKLQYAGLDYPAIVLGSYKISGI